MNGPLFYSLMVLNHAEPIHIHCRNTQRQTKMKYWAWFQTGHLWTGVYRLFLFPVSHPFLCFFLLSEEITLSEALHLARVRPSLNGSNLDCKEKKTRRIEKKRGFQTLILPQQKQSAVAPHPFAFRSKPQAKYNMRKSSCYFLRSRVPGRQWHDVFLSHSEDKSTRQRQRERHRRNCSSRIGKEDSYRQRRACVNSKRAE